MPAIDGTPGTVTRFPGANIAPCWIEPPGVPHALLDQIDAAADEARKQVHIAGKVKAAKAARSELNGLRNIVAHKNAVYGPIFKSIFKEDTMNCDSIQYGADPCRAPEAPETVKQARARLKRDVKGAKAALKRFDADQKARRKTQAEYKAKVAQREADRELAMQTLRELTNVRHAGPVRSEAAQKLLNS